MGEIADMMIDGTLCEQCGEYLGEGDGYPRYCGACGYDEEPPIKNSNSNQITINNKVNCPKCGKKVKAVGLHMHMQRKHPEYSVDAKVAELYELFGDMQDRIATLEEAIISLQEQTIWISERLKEKE